MDSELGSSGRIATTARILVAAFVWAMIARLIALPVDLIAQALGLYVLADAAAGPIALGRLDAAAWAQLLLNGLSIVAWSALGAAWVRKSPQLREHYVVLGVSGALFFVFLMGPFASPSWVIAAVGAVSWLGFLGVGRTLGRA